MVGIPIFGGFAMKLLFAQAAVMEVSVRKMMMVMLALAVSSLLNVMYFIRTLVRIYTDPEKDKPVPEKEESPEDREDLEIGKLSYGAAGMILTAANVVLGLFSWAVVNMIYRGLSMFQ